VRGDRESQLVEPGKKNREKTINRLEEAAITQSCGRLSLSISLRTEEQGNGVQGRTQTSRAAQSRPAMTVLSHNKNRHNVTAKKTKESESVRTECRIRRGTTRSYQQGRLWGKDTARAPSWQVDRKRTHAHQGNRGFQHDNAVRAEGNHGSPPTAESMVSNASPGTPTLDTNGQ